MRDAETQADDLYLSLIGSPSGTKEQDILTWVKRAGAASISGEGVYDGGGDVFTETF